MGRELSMEVIGGGEVAFSGRLDARTAAAARALLHELIDHGHGELRLRVPDLEIWDASGLGVLVGGQRRARRSGRRLVLVGVSPRQMRLLRATRLVRLLEDSAAAAG